MKLDNWLEINFTIFFLLGKYDKFYEKGVYLCIVCRQELFHSETKFDAGCGWPAFNDVVDQGKVTLLADPSIPGMLKLN